MPNRLCLRIATACVLGLVWCSAAMADGIISNGTVSLGVEDFGNLGVTPPTGTPVGIQLTLPAPFHDSQGNPTSVLDALFAPEVAGPINAGEGWGIAFMDGGNLVDGFVRKVGTTLINRGHLNATNLNPGLNLVSFASTALTATSVVNSVGAPQVVIAQNYMPTSTPFLFEDKVTISNTGSTSISDLLYRRIINFNPEPTPGSAGDCEFMTIIGHGNPFVLHQDDGAFVNPNPTSAPVPQFPGSLDTDVTDLGPPLVCDHGVDYYFQLGSVGALGSKTFSLYFGAAPTEADALAALSSVGANSVYALAQSSGLDANGNPSQISGSPATWIFAFKGPAAVPEPGVPAMFAGLLAGGWLVFRKRK